MKNNSSMGLFSSRSNIAQNDHINNKKITFTNYTHFSLVTILLLKWPLLLKVVGQLLFFKYT